MRQSLAVKYRPKDWSEVVAQSYTTQILQKQLDTKSFKNVYLFTGSAGTGKTTCARIMADKINNHQGSPIEIDAASNSGVDDVRRIVEESRIKSMDSYYKVYILDECHSFSNTAWQAFLKCIEEPPSRTIYIFCTTDAQKIPPTILSRLQRFDFQRIPLENVVARLQFICESENISYDKDALEYIAKLTDGGMRDAITSMDKVFSYSDKISLTKVIEALGVANYKVMFDLTNHIIDRNELDCLNLINNLHQQGKDLKLFLNEYLYFLLDINKYILKPDFENIKVPIIYEADLKNVIGLEGAKEFYDLLLNRFITMKEVLRWETQIKTNMELNILKLCRC